jgi:hypothetical protein
MIRFLCEREIPERPDWWHKWNTMLWPVKTTDGKWTHGLVFRRQTDSGWEYQSRQPDRIEWPREAW